MEKHNNTKKYYKVVSGVCLFKTLYKITDITNIPSGTRFVAKFFPHASPDFIAQNKKPVLLFSDSAFDAMLWYSVFNNIRWDLVAVENWQDTTIYEIKPITPVFKERCRLDENGLFQCATNTIEFCNRVPLDVMISNALTEYNYSKIKKNLQYLFYNRDFIMKNVRFWQEKVQEQQF